MPFDTRMQDNQFQVKKIYTMVYIYTGNTGI